MDLAWYARWASIKNHMTLRQSSVSDYRYCPFKYMANSRSLTRDLMAPHYYGGAILHRYIELIAKYDVTITQEIAEQVHNELTGYDLPPSYSVHRVFDKEVFYGLSLVDLAVMTVSSLRDLRFNIEGVEKHHSHKVGKVTFEGTIDLLCSNATGRYLLDTKSGGIWRRFFEGGSLKRQSYTKDEVVYSPQLNHYAWLEDRFNKPVDYIGYIVPVNFVPNQKNGEIKSPFFIQPVGDLSIHDEDLFNVACDIDRNTQENRWPRGKPQTYGKLDCVSCQYKSTCLDRVDRRIVLPYEV